MRMFLYYALHSFINQLRKIFKTWVMIFILICFAVGVGIGLLAASISDMVEEKGQGTEIVEEQELELSEEDEEEQLPEKPNYIESTIGYSNFVELIAGAVILLSFGFSVMNADKNAGKIFLPADVTLLFPSPMRPQSVMMFRVATQFGQMIFIGLYLLFQLPNLVLNMGLGIWAALALILAFCLTTFLGTLLQLLFYLLGSIYDTFKRLLRPILYACILLIVGGFLLFQKSQGLDYITAGSAFFNSKYSRFIPLWGWLKAFCRFSVDGNATGALLCLGAVAVGTALLIWIIWHLKVDFYEDAMTKAEEVAAVMERAQSEKSSGVIIQRKKDRSDRLKRDGMRHGAGANVFFFKAMYNRFRFAHFGFLTKTMEFYLVVAVAVGLFCRYSMETREPLLLIGVMAGLVFFRSLGNPLEADTKMDYFIMIPESTWSKLFYSLMAGTANAALDLILPMIVGSLIIGSNPLISLLWILPILSVDFYSTTVGVFIGLSVPTSAGKMIKQMVQILFVYFGLLPDIVIIAIGFALGQLAIGIGCAILANILLGGFFFALSPLFLDPVSKHTPKDGEDIFSI